MLEARGRTGGRLQSIPINDAAIDLGATWTWKNESLVNSLVRRFRIPTHAQHLEGDAVLETTTVGDVQRVGRTPQHPWPQRFSTGAQSLTDQLHAALPDGAVQLNAEVRTVLVRENLVEVHSPSARCTARQVILALPPALAVNSIAFNPPLPPQLKTTADSTAVWMGDIVKAVAVYERPFWRDHGLAGFGVSYAGPFHEFHDHSGPKAHPAALFGFAPAGIFERAGSNTIETAFIDQLARTYGSDAANARDVHCVDWSAERYTAPKSTASDASTTNYGATIYSRPILDRIHWAATETSTQFPGHIEGAIESGLRAARAAHQTLTPLDVRWTHVTSSDRSVAASTFRANAGN